LYHVSAAELKAEEMIKLPIMLTEHENWQASVRDAVLTQNKLLTEANKESEYIRPIVLFQADNKKGEVTVDVLKQFLLEELHIDEEKIAIATGNQRELDGINLFARACPIEFVITVEALKEGWDCSFAYVFCSVKPVRSAKDAEQLLGRVLRMPYAKRRQQDALNRAYAHLASPSFSQAAQELTDQLVNMGFEAVELAANVLPAQDLFSEQGDSEPVAKPLTLELPNNEKVVAAAQELLGKPLVTNSDETFTIEVMDFITEEKSSALIKVLKGKEKKAVVSAVEQHNARVEALRCPAERGEVFPDFPQLFFPVQGELELLEKETYLHLHEWSLLDFTIELPHFSLRETSTTFEVDIEGSKVDYHIAEETGVYNLDLVDGGFTESELVRWLDQQLRQPDISQSELMAYFVRLISHLTTERGIPLTGLFRSKFILAKSIRQQIESLREKVAKKSFQQVLFDEVDQLETRFDFSYEFHPDRYPARPPYYSGRFRFQKHYYNVIEDLKAEGEEFECAQAIERQSQVKYWIRNLVQRDFASFSLPLAGRNFYPDFIAVLDDGRRLVIEYKGEAYKTNDDSKEKIAVGEAWAEKGGDECLFLMAVKQDDQGLDVYQQIGQLVDS